MPAPWEEKQLAEERKEDQALFAAWYNMLESALTATKPKKARKRRAPKPSPKSY